jgi:hypothetical protein
LQSFSRAFQVAFTSGPAASFTVFGRTNPALPLRNWTPLGGATERSPGRFQFTDLGATETPGRVYRVRSP